MLNVLAGSPSLKGYCWIVKTKRSQKAKSLALIEDTLLNVKRKMQDKTLENKTQLCNFIITVLLFNIFSPLKRMRGVKNTGISKISLKMYKRLRSDYYAELKISVFSFKVLSNFYSVKFKHLQNL